MDVAGWEEKDGKLARTFQFKDFVEAMKFVNRMADLAEAEGHHPDFAVHYSRVNVTLWTHTAGGVTDKDRRLAEKINQL